MHACRRAIAALLLMALPAMVCAESERRVYGGRGEDRLFEIAEAGGGLFAAGTTASADGDLSMRTRTGETGWAMLTKEDGERQWSYASGRSGMTRLSSPAPLDDGGFSLVLMDEEGRRFDWIVLDDRGRLRTRTEASAGDFGESLRIEQTLLCSRSSPAIAVIAGAEDGSVHAFTLDGQSGVNTLGRFLPEGGGKAVSDGNGALAWIGAQNGCMTVTRLTGGMESSAVRFDGLDVLSIADALMQDDGSVVCCGEAQTDGGAAGFAARVSREGDVLFAARFVMPQRCLCQTETGYAVCGAWEEGSSVAFFDEDGGLLGESAFGDPDVLDIAGVPGGCALLTHIDGYRQKQAAITPVYPDGGAALGLLIPEEAAETPAQQAYLPELAVGGGYLLCSGDSMGVQVTLMDEGGASLWSTRIPIHTAADTLEWCCAARLEDGSVFLGGRYLMGEGGGASQRGAIALLGGDGVLRRVEELPGAGAVVKAELLEGGMIRLHVSGSETPDLTADSYIDMAL